MDPSAFIIDDEEFMSEIITILNSFDNDYLVLLPEDTASIERLSQVDSESFVSMTAPEREREEKSSFSGTQGQGALAVNEQLEPDTIEKRSPTIRGRSRGRFRIREQLIQLRAVVKKMENHLETLKNPPESLHFDSCDDNQSIMARSEKQAKVNTVWRSIATEQFRARRKAEVHNAQLRENLWASIQLSEQVKKLLQDQQAHSAISC
ncbi:hypothetical protein L917_11265 [Phytophthora nicotianae]|uniref:Uncharacterized protein n=1 Tax=Phytophthora nicotianae TaxID=4792 RepID=W2KXK3_PHYNI|nr:hypothetical protein L917_11265 [Phytophthora nicotianae]